MTTTILPSERAEVNPDYGSDTPARQCGKGWAGRCAAAKRPRCKCSCGGHNHGAKKTDADHEPAQDNLPPALQQFRLDYEGYYSEGAFATVRLYRAEDGTPIIVATDESRIHKNTSVTNRVERVMYLAWMRIGRPWPCLFAEHYRREDIGELFSTGPDQVQFALDESDRPLEVPLWFQGRAAGKEFEAPQWRPLDVPLRIGA